MVSIEKSRSLEKRARIVAKEVHQHILYTLHETAVPGSFFFWLLKKIVYIVYKQTLSRSLHIKSASL